MNGASVLPAPPVLLVEDNPDDVALVRRALRKAALDLHLVVLEDGKQAQAYLDARMSAAERGARPWPSLVLLDWRLPLASGEEVLRWARAQAHLEGLPIVVLTSSDEREDIDAAYAAGASSYLRKPVEFARLVRLLDTLHLYWLRTNLPPAIGSKA